MGTVVSAIYRSPFEKNMEQEPEIFKPIKGYEGYYEISSWGRVKSLARRWSVGVKKDSFLKHGKKRVANQYLNVIFCVDKKKEIRSVHRLVAEYFCEKKEGYDIVNHLDSDIFNNYYKNLEWTTYRGNAIHGFEVGFRKGQKGATNPMAKYNEADILKIRELNEKYQITAKDIAELYDDGVCNIARIIRRERWKHI